jgi:uncharacterized protein (TIGR03437 family)
MRSLKAALSLVGLAGLCMAQTTTSLPLTVKPDSLTFRQSGTAAPTAQTIDVTAKKGTLGALTVTPSGGTWLKASASGSTVSVSVSTASLASGKYTGAVAIAATGFTTASVPVALTITGNNVIADPATLNFSAVVGGEADPNPKMVDIYNDIGSSFSWTAAADQSWLVISPTSGTGKSSLSVSVNPAKLSSAGSLTGQVTVTDTSNSTTATVTVHLTATAPVPPSFQMGPYLDQPGVLYFESDTDLGKPAPKIFYGRNLGGGGSLSFTLTGAVNSPANGSWMSFTPASNNTPGLTTVTVNPAGLQPGSYSATISGAAKDPAGVTGGSLTSHLTVYLALLGSPAVNLAPKFMRFTASTKTTPPTLSPASQTVTFATNSTTGYPYTTTATTASGGPWLSASPGGTATNGATFTVSVNPTVVAGLSPGFYTGQVQVNFMGGAPTPVRTIGVGLRVYSTSDSPQLVVNPGGLAFTATAGGANPAAKNVNVRAESAGSSGLGYTVASAVSTPTGGSWLSAGSAGGTATATATAVPINVTLGKLAAGTYSGTVTFTPDPSSNAAPQIVNVNLVVASSSNIVTADAVSRGAKPSASAPAILAPGPLVATITDPPDNFTGSTDSALNVAVNLLDSAGDAVPGATVILSSSNGEPDVTMTDMGNGNYAGLFQPAVSGTVTLSVAAQATDSTGNLFQASPALVTGDIVSVGDVSTPVYTNGAVGSASFAPQPTPITPGGLISLFGTNIAGSGGTAPSVPLPAALGGASVSIGGVAAPLIGAFPASTPGGLDQINLQVPFEVDGQPEADLVVTSNGVIGAPQAVPLGAAPALFTQNATGSGDGAFVHTDGVTLITPASPAAAGEVIVLYATGLGDVQSAVPSGAAATGVDNLTSSVRVTIGGLPATVSYAGLAPFSVGEYQLNVVVPAGLPSGENDVIVFLNGAPATGRATVALQ